MLTRASADNVRYGAASMRRTTGAALAVLVGTVVVTACSSSGPKLVVLNPTDGGGVAASDTTPLDTPYVFPLEHLCTPSGKAIKVTKVTPAHPRGGIRVVDWGIRLDSPGGPYLTGSPGGLPDRVSDISGFDRDTPVTAPCSNHSKRINEFDVSLSRSTPKATMTGVWLYYGSGQRAFAQYAFRLCASKRCPPPGMAGN